MAKFFLFGTYTQSLANTNPSKRTNRVKDIITKLGGVVNEMYSILGQIDVVVIAEFEDPNMARKASIALNYYTHIKFSTCPAITIAEHDNMVHELFNQGLLTVSDTPENAFL